MKTSHPPRMLLYIGLVGVTWIVAGCNKGPDFHPVRGRVTLGETPVTGATILFTDAATGIAVTSPLGEDGSYRIRTYEGDGLRAGTYQVAVTPGGTMRDDTETPLAGQAVPPPQNTNASEIPEIYHSASTSPLRVEVVPGEPREFNFDLSK